MPSSRCPSRALRGLSISPGRRAAALPLRCERCWPARPHATPQRPGPARRARRLPAAGARARTPRGGAAHPPPLPHTRTPAAAMASKHTVKTVEFLGRKVPILMQGAAGPSPLLAIGALSRGAARCATNWPAAARCVCTSRAVAGGRARAGARRARAARAAWRAQRARAACGRGAARVQRCSKAQRLTRRVCLPSAARSLACALCSECAASAQQRAAAPARRAVLHGAAVAGGVQAAGHRLRGALRTPAHATRDAENPPQGGQRCGGPFRCAAAARRARPPAARGCTRRPQRAQTPAGRSLRPAPPAARTQRTL
jgi:hypothetical protein